MKLNRKPNRNGYSGKNGSQQRRGAILVMAAFCMIIAMAIVAFVVDLGYIAATHGELQSTADGCALASAIELPKALGPAPETSQQGMQQVAKSAAYSVASANPNATYQSTYIDTNSDVRFGRIVWNPTTSKYVKTWGVTPANMVEVTIRRTDSNTDSSGKSLNLFFAPILGKNKTDVIERAVAGTFPGAGVSIPPSSTNTATVLPIAIDDQSWNSLMAGGAGFADSYACNPSNLVCSPGSDGIKELNIYPDPNSNLPAGNRGTVDLGSPSNSTNDLKRQIVDGLNAYDLSFFPNNEIRTDQGPLVVNGDTGISAGIKAQLEAVKGRPCLVPIYSCVGSDTQCTNWVPGGNPLPGGGKAAGNNVYYRITRFVGARIVHVNLTGSNKVVYVQPATFVSKVVIPNRTQTVTSSTSYFSKPYLLE